MEKRRSRNKRHMVRELGTVTRKENKQKREDTRRNLKMGWEISKHRAILFFIKEGSRLESAE